LALASLTVGDDFRFGANRAGDFDLLTKWGSKKGIEVTNTETFNYEDQRVSSTRIRNALLNDDFQLAEILLGRSLYLFRKSSPWTASWKNNWCANSKYLASKAKTSYFWSVCC
jgi:FAD synthase